MKKEWLFVAAVCAVLFFFNAPQIFRSPGYNTALHLADSFLQGRLDVDPPEDPIDLIQYAGRTYVPFPPAPALLMVPFVAVFGVGFMPIFLAPLLGGLTAWVLFRLYRRLTDDDEIAYWLAAAMIFGTAYWLCVRYVFDTYLAHMLAVLAVSIALLESFGRQRGWIVGLFLGIACASRQLSVFVVPFAFALLFFLPRAPSPWWKRLVPCFGAAAALGLVFAGLLGYNWARFGSPFEDGYAWVVEETWYAVRLEKWGNFNWRYIPSNVLRMFVMGFSIDFRPPDYMVPSMSPWGTSLTFASPFIFFALRGKLAAPKLVNAAGWLCAGVILLALLMHKSAGGGWQINGMRYALDFLPLVSLYAAMGMKRHNDACGKSLRRSLVAYSILLNVAAIAITHARHLFPA
jgi:4-amino-4-deoxy-L-arabinose transferase-like glycosyltransferase